MLLLDPKWPKVTIILCQVKTYFTIFKSFSVNFSTVACFFVQRDGLPKKLHFNYKTGHKQFHRFWNINYWWTGWPRKNKKFLAPQIYLATHSRKPFGDIWYGLREKWLSRVGGVKKKLPNLNLLFPILLKGKWVI